MVCELLVKTIEEATWIFEQIQSFEKAGPLGRLKSKSFRQICWSRFPDGPVWWFHRLEPEVVVIFSFMFAEDILGNHAPPYPRHTKQYRNLFEMEQAIQKERVGGFRDFIADVKSGGFPGPEHVVKAPDGLVDLFLAKLGG